MPAIETETRTNIPWRYGDLTILTAEPFVNSVASLVGNTGTTAARATGRASAVDAHALAIGDVNNDGMDDIVVGDYGGVFALLQTASGTFTRVSNALFDELNLWVDHELPGATYALLLDLAMGDLNGDGADDLIVGWGHATVASRVFFNDGNGGFSRANSTMLPPSAYGTANTIHLKTFVEDFDGDGDKDLVLLHARAEPYYAGNYVQFLANDGKGRFTDETVQRFGNPAASPDFSPERLEWSGQGWFVVDVNGDGALDILGHHVGRHLPFYYLNDGKGRFTAHDIVAPAGVEFVTIGDFDGNGRLDAVGFQSQVDLADFSRGLNVFTHYELTRVVPPADARAYDLAGNAGTVAKILGAVFGPAAVGNQRYVGIGLHYLEEQGYGDEALARLAIDARLGQGASHAQVVDLLYTNVVGQPPAADVRAGFVAMLESGSVSVGGLGLLAANTPLNQANIDLVGLASTGLDYLPFA